MANKLKTRIWPKCCRKCPFVSYTKSKMMFCKLTEADGFFDTFRECPLKECVYMKKQKAVKIYAMKSWTRNTKPGTTRQRPRGKR